MRPSCWRRLASLTAFFASICLPMTVAAQAIELAPTGGGPVITSVMLSLLALLPFALVITTSFAKIAVVLSLLRTALGTPSVPPNMVLAALALVLSAFVMAPVGAQVLAAAGPLFDALGSPDGPPAASLLLAHAAAAIEPLRAFLEVNAGQLELQTFANMRGVTLAEQVAVPWSVAMPAFAITELSEAFQIGFLLYLPFLVLDLLVGSVLLSLGMHMLTPTTVSTPFKLLLFVMVNGWLVLSESLVLAYTMPGTAQ
ncbi:MAG: type III secretion protein R [Bradymonadia bacterium]|jgi:type III secretion protein R